MQRRFCVFGAGAIGGHLAAKLAAAGHEVAAVARGATLAALQASGVALKAGERTIRGRVRAAGSAAQLGPQDAVFVTTKATGLGDFAAAAPALAGPETLFVFVQNGVPWWYAQGLSAARRRPPDLQRLDPGGRLARAIPAAGIAGAVVYSSNDIVAPGVVENSTAGRNMLVIGAPDDREDARIAALREVLGAADMHSPPTRDIRASVWDKLVINLGSALCVAVGEPLAALIEDPALRAARERIFAEGRAVARAHGVAVEDAPRRPGAGAQASSATRHKPSMLQDYELGRPMEIEAILAAPLAFARAAGVETPALETLAAVVARLAAAKGLYAAA